VCTGAWYWHARDVSEAHKQFSAVTQGLTDDVERVLLQYGQLLSGSGALFHQGVVTRAQYHSYLEAVGFGSPRFPGLEGVGFVQKVVPSQVPRFLASLAADGIQASVLPSGSRSQYCLGSYADWSRLNYQVPLYGYDLCTVPTLADALSAATATGEQQVVVGPALGPLYLSDFVLAQPVYSGSPRSESERRQDVSGWVVAITNGSDLLKKVKPIGSVHFAVYSESGPAAAIGVPVLRWPASVALGSRWSAPSHLFAYSPWEIRFQTQSGAPSPGGQLAGPLVLLVAGLAAVALLVALIASLLKSRRTADEAVRVATRSLQASEEKFRSLAAAAPIGILEVAPVASVNFANSKAAEIAGRSIEELKGRGWMDTIHPDDAADLIEIVDATAPRRDQIATTFRIRRPDGAVRHVRLIAAPKGDLRESGYVVTVSDVTEEVRAHDELSHRALYDSLTGLPNRALFLDRLEHELAGRARSGANVAVLFLDLDRFKFVNDSFGHDTGDTVLKEIAARLQDSVRVGETAARFSGDEFIFMIRGVGSVDDAARAAKRLLRVIEAPVHCDGQSFTVSGSIGIVVPGPLSDANSVLRDADTAMYKAKAAGGGRYEVFDEELHRWSVERLVVERELRDAVENAQLDVFYQPKVEVSSWRPVGAEALVRWRHPTRGIVVPSDFVAVAEESGLIIPIGRFVLERAVAQLASWDSAEGAPRLEVMAVNLSARQLADEETPGLLEEVVSRHGIDPDRLTIEVTESALMSDDVCTHRSLEAMRALGLRVAIDDFGTGYSSLSYLHALPVTTVKVDRSFVERLADEDSSAAVVRAIVEMSHAMGMRVVAEGVSTARLAELVGEMGCDHAQGFLWSPPVPAEAFETWWRGASEEHGLVSSGAWSN
jgi:diguanylate cyclase (GGDEF)-like protein/PAS domain S-box-containing protein